MILTATFATLLFVSLAIITLIDNLGTISNNYFSFKIITDKKNIKWYHNYKHDKKYSFYQSFFWLITIIIALYFYGPSSYKASLFIIFSHLLLILSVIDFKYQILPNILNFTLLIIGLLVNYFNIFISFSEAIIGAALGFLSLWSINFLFKVIRKKEGIGRGDFKLLAAIGAWTGYIYLPLIITMSAYVALFFALIAAIFFKFELAKKMPFGPSIALAAFISLILGEKIINYYLIYGFH